jgi:hypothetical protein
VSPLDVRDLHGRMWRWYWSVLAGAMLAVIIAAVLPQRSMRGWGGGAFDLTNPLLVASGAVAIAIGINALLGAVARMPPRVRIKMPRAMVVRRR